MEKYTGETKVKMRNRISCMIKVIYVMAVCVLALNVKPSRFAENIGLLDVQAETSIEDGFVWHYDTVSENTIEITFWASHDNKSVSDVVIPAEIDGKTVVGIRKFCDDGTMFYEEDYYWGIKSITISEGITRIGENAFTGCEGLENVIIPASVTNIEERAFENCYSLENVTLSNGIVSIGKGAFANCALKSIYIPASVTDIGGGAFSHNYCIESIRVDENNIRYADWGTNAIIDNETKTLVSGCKNTTSIPNSVTCIGEGAFSSCSKLTSITIPSSVTSIGDSAFSGCSKLISITIPSSVTSIGDSAFSGCSKLTSITIPSSVTSIGDSAFSNCSNLASITIPSSVTSIGDGAFWYCSNLTSITIPSSVTRIEEGAFDECSSLKDVYYGGSKSDWDKIDISECNDNLLKATIHFGKTDPVQPETPASTENKTPVTNTTPVKAENGSQVKTSDKGTATITTAAPSDKKNVSIPSVVIVGGVEYDVTEIGANAFKNLKKTTTVTLPKTVKKIAANAFSKSKVKTVKLTVNKGQKLTIDKKAFKNSKVQKVQITVSKKATAKEIKALKSALKKAGIKEKNIKISKKLK